MSGGSDIDWIIVQGQGGVEIGAVGFIGNKTVAIVSFFEDDDANLDGDVSWKEWAVSAISPLSFDGMAATRVAMQGRYNMDIVLRDPNYRQLAAQKFVGFAHGLIQDAFWELYFKNGASMLSNGIAKTITGDKIKQYVISKGSEDALRKAFDRSTAL